MLNPFPHPQVVHMEEITSYTRFVVEGCTLTKQMFRKYVIHEQIDAPIYQEVLAKTLT